jgi:hypothetical protein
MKRLANISPCIPCHVNPFIALKGAVRPSSNPNNDRQPKMKACRFFQQGRCTKGSACPFRHDLLSAQHLEAKQAVASTGTNSTILCRYFQAGSCRNGIACHYSHARSSESSQDMHSDLGQQFQHRDSRSQINCTFYLRGKCENGTNCPYRHAQEGHQDDEAEAHLEVRPRTAFFGVSTQ